MAEGRLSHWRDVAGTAAVGLGVLAASRHREPLSTAGWRGYLLGAAIGATWEVGFHRLGPAHRPCDPMFTNHEPFPGPCWLQPVTHSFGDAALFLGGAGLTRALLGPGRWQGEDNARELAVLMLWGGGTALAVELACNGVLWTYHPRPWNPVMMRRGDRTYTWLPQLVWVLGPPLWHRGRLALERQSRARPQVSR